MDASPLTDAERAFLLGLERRGVLFLLVGMSGALLQGARGATEDLDLWFADPADPRIAEAAREVGAVYFAGSFGMRPPSVSGGPLGDRIDVVTHMHGLASFDEEAGRSTRSIRIDEGLEVPVLALDRILASKRATGRAKDLAQIPALETALALLAADSEG